MDKFEYQPATLNASTVKMDGPRGFAGTAENVRSREWAREFGKRNLMSAVRLAREVEVDFNADYETMDALREAADADLYNLTPGTFVAQGEWRQCGYVLQSMPKGIHFGWVSTALTIALLDGAWWRVRGVSLLPESTAPIGKQYKSGTGERVRTEGAADEGLHALTIYGKSVQDGTPTPDNPVPVQVVKPLIWNQLIKNGNFAENSGWQGGSGVTVSISGNKLTATGTTSSYLATYLINANQFSCVSGHKYLIAATVSCSSGKVWILPTGLSAGGTISSTTATTEQRIGGIITAPSSETYSMSVRFQATASGTSEAVTGTLRDYVCIDLTQMFGSGNEPATVAEFEERFPDAYYPYDAGSELFAINCGGIQTPIDMDGNVLASLPDGTRDELNIDSAGNVTITKRIGHVLIDGTTNKVNITISSGGRYHGLYDFTAGTLENSGTQTQKTTYLMASNLQSITPDAEYFGNTGICVASDRFVRFNDSGITEATSAAVNTWLQANNVDLYVKLATPQTITLDPITMPHPTPNGEVSITAAVTPTITAEWELAQHINLDYPHDYPYDYSEISNNKNVNTGRLVPCKPRIIFYGPATNPEITLAGNKYKVTASIASGGRIEVDGREMTVEQITQGGTVTDKFSDALRGSGQGGGEYIFEPIPPGDHAVTWDGTFGVDIGWYEEVGEPPWSQS